MRPSHGPRLFFDGRHYDQKWRNLTVDLPFWVGQGRKFGDPILELACGTGRAALRLARSSFRVTGIDVSDSMLAEARKKAAQEGLEVEWVKGDIRQFDLAKQFPLIIFPFNTICILYKLEELEACLGCVKKHLHPGAGSLSISSLRAWSCCCAARCSDTRTLSILTRMETELWSSWKTTCMIPPARSPASDCITRYQGGLRKWTRN